MVLWFSQRETQSAVCWHAIGEKGLPTPHKPLQIGYTGISGILHPSESYLNIESTVLLYRPGRLVVFNADNRGCAHMMRFHTLRFQPSGHLMVDVVTLHSIVWANQHMERSLNW